MLELNPAQKKAVEAPEKPILVLAGPGTGKTRTLIERIAYFIRQKGYKPENILAITFTNKAAQELKDRLHESVGEEAENVEAGTFHSFCLKILRENHHFFGLPRYFNIADSQYQEQIIRDYLADPQPESKIIKGFLRGISNHKLQKTPFKTEIMQAVWEYYNKTLKEINAIDFDDIMLMARTLFTMRADVLEYWQNSYKAILVDEFQDTDKIQYGIIRELAAGHRNIFVVADDDQSIFSWRGADPENIERYISDFNIKKEDIIVLNKNYRTTSEIFTLAQKPLEPTSRIFPEKNIEVTRKGGKKVKIHFFRNRTEEGQYISSQINSWISEEKLNYSDIAVIYPRHIIGKQIEKELLKARIPCKMALGRSILEHPAVRNILAFLRFTLNPKDEIAFRNIFQTNLEESSYKKLEKLSLRLNNNFRLAVTKALLLPDFSFEETRTIKSVLGKISNILSESKRISLHSLLAKILSGKSGTGLFYLKRYSDKLTDPLHEFPENRNAIRTFEKQMEKNSQLIIHSGNPAADLLLKLTAYNIFPNLKVFTQSEAETSNQNFAFGDTVIFTIPGLTEELDFNFHDKADFIKIIFHNDKSELKANEYLFLSHARTFSAAFFKFVQAVKTIDGFSGFPDYTIIDLETTDKDVENCDIVEIAAVKIRNGRETARYQTLVKPKRKVSRKAQEVHGIDEKKLKNSPLIDEIWPDFLSFIGNDILIAHNGVNFDFRILNRVNKRLSGDKLANIVFDTLPLARELFPGESASIDALSAKFGLDPGNRHRALDDVLVLNEIYKKLNEEFARRMRITVFEEFLPDIAMAMALENKPLVEEEQLLYQIGYISVKHKKPSTLPLLEKVSGESADKLLGKFRQVYEKQTPLIAGEENSREKLQELFLLAMEYEKQFPEPKEAMSQFIQFLALYNDAQELDNGINAVNLLTLHTSKGLEFKKVIIAGLEDNNLPSYWSYQTDDLDDIPISKKQEEQRRLFYVGMTRARDELILTSSQYNEQLKEEKPSPFLRELE